MKFSIEYTDFKKIDFRAGTIIQAEDFPEDKKAAYNLKIDLGAELGIKILLQ